MIYRRNNFSCALHVAPRVVVIQAFWAKVPAHRARVPVGILSQ